MLRRILLVARRDFTAAVMTKAFVIGLVVLPLMMGSGFFGFALLRVTQGETAKRVAIIDHTGMAAASIIRAAEIQTAEDKAGKATPQQIVPARFVFEEVRADDPLALSDQVRQRKLAGFLEIQKVRSILPRRTRNRAGRWLSMRKRETWEPLRGGCWTWSKTGYGARGWRSTDWIRPISTMCSAPCR